MALDRKIIVLYHIDELTTKDFRNYGVKSAETIRYQLFFKEPQMQKRNHNGQIKMILKPHFSKLATGVLKRHGKDCFDNAVGRVL